MGDDAKPLDDLKDLKLTDRPKLKPPRTLEITLFDRLESMFGGGIKRVLNTQYRSVALRLLLLFD